MRKLPVILDIETKHTFREFSENSKLGISLAGGYQYATEQIKTFRENELQELFKILENASHIVGFNIRSFDLQVLQPYYPGDLSKFPILDILDEIKEKIGSRRALHDILKATMGKGKTGHGLIAINYFREGKWDELEKYCIDDVMLTKELFDYGVQNNQIFYLRDVQRVPITVDWKKYFESPQSTDTHLTLPF